MYEYDAFVNRVVDGDTYDVQIDLGFELTYGRSKKGVRLRLRGVDTPETWRPTTEAEREHGERATQFVKDLIEGKFVKIKTYKMGIYGRYEADVKVPSVNGITTIYRDLGKILEENFLVKAGDYGDGHV